MKLEKEFFKLKIFRESLVLAALIGLLLLQGACVHRYGYVVPNKAEGKENAKK